MHDALPHRFSIAPMMAYTCPHGRYLMRLLAPHVRLYSEMIVAQALVHGHPERLLAHRAIEAPLSIQLAAAEPEILVKAITVLRNHTNTGAIAEINLNLGCPSSRVQSGGFGVCQIKNPHLCRELVAAMKETSPVPISVKTRLGVDNIGGEDYINDFCQGLVQAGCDHFILHARHAWLDGLDPKQNRHIPPLDHAMVIRLKQRNPSWRVIINGGFTSHAACMDILHHIDGVMIGRAAFANPWLITKLEKSLFGTPAITPSQLMQKLCDYWQQEFARGASPVTLLRAAMHLFQGKKGAKQWRQAIARNQHCKAPDFAALYQLSLFFTDQ